jgi:TP901 family phage tail tape measure protein
VAVTARTIPVSVEGSSTSLQEAAKKAADSLKLLGEETMRQSQVSIDWSDKVMRSNLAVADSYTRMGEAARLSAGGIVSLTDTSLAAQGRLAESTTKTTDTIVSAAERQLEATRAAAASQGESYMTLVDAAQASADMQARASTTIIEATQAQADAIKRASVVADDAYGSTADAAATSAKAQRDAADANVDSAARSGAAAKDSATKQDAAAAISGSAMAKLGKATTLGALGVGAASIYMAAHFEASTTRLLTQAGATEKQVAQMRKGILGMAGVVGQSPEHLSESLYHVVSSMNAVLPAAHRTTEELAIQKIAAEGAAVGHTNLEETTYALASAMNALGLRAGAAEKTMGTLNAIVGSGDMTMGDLLAALKSGVIPAARTFGVSLESMGSALSVMGDEGMRGAQAGTRLRMSLALLAAPSGKAAEYLQALGMSGAEVKARTEAMTDALDKAGLKTTTLGEDLRKPDGLAVAFKDLKDHLEASGLSATQASEVISKAFGGGRSSAAIELMVNSVGRLESKYNQIQRTTAAFNKDWEERQKNAGFQAEQLEDTVKSLGVSIGTDLLPDAKELVGTLKETVEWFEKGSGGARALEYAIGGVLATAVVTYGVGSMAKFANSIKNVYAEYGKLQAYLRGGFGMSTPATGEATVATAALGAPTGTGGVLGIGGARSGPGLPGSMTDPLIVAVESGEVAGLGGSAAEGTVVGETPAAARAAENEARTAGGVVLPAGVSAPEAPVAPVYAGAALPTAEEAASMGVVATVRKSVGDLAANAMKGAMVAGMGSLVAQMAGSAIGGKAGKDVAGVGTDTALGAGLGSFLGPEGTVAGGMAGALYGGLKAFADSNKIQPEGEKFAKEFMKPYGTVLGPEIRKNTESALSKHINELQKLEHPQTGKQAFEEILDPFGLESHHGTPDKANVVAKEKEVGREAGQAFAKAYGEVKVPTTAIFLRDSTAALDALKAGPLRDAAARQMLEYASGLEKEGALPKGAVARILKGIEAQFPNLQANLKEQGTATAAAIAAGLNLASAEHGVKASLSSIEKTYGTFGMNVGQTMEALEHVIKVTTGSTRKEAEHNLEGLTTAYGLEWKAIQEKVENSTKEQASVIAKLSREMAVLGKPGFEKYNTDVQKWAETLTERVGMGVESLGKGVGTINKMLETELSDLGAGKGTSKALVTGVLPTAKQFFKESPFGAAQGGLIQLGRPGEAGRDSIPMNAGGVPIVAAPGEQIAVLTRHQQAIANQRLADMGGLAGLFRNVSTPNYMAQGGFVAEPGQNFTYGYEPRIVADLRKFAAEMRETVYGVSGYRSPAHSVAVGGSSNDPHTEGKAADIGLGSPTLASMVSVPESDLRKVGLYRPFYPPDSAEANHVQLIGVPFGNSSGAPGGGGVVAAVQQQFKEIMAPKVGGSGVFQSIAQAALDQVTKAANERLGSAAGGSSGGGLPSAGGTYNRSMLERLWDSAGGTPSEAHLMAAIALAESAGNPNAHNPSGATGLWQILGSIIPGNLDNPMVNARNAVAKFRSQGLGAWETYTNGAYRRYMAEGGIVGAAQAEAERFATGGPVPHTLTSSQKAAAKAKITKPPTPKPRITKSAVPALAKKLGNLQYLPGLETLQAHMEPYEKGMKALSNLDTLIKGLESDKNGTFILQTDMQYLSPTLQAGQTINPGMMTAQAMQSYENALVQHGSSPSLELQGQIIKWAEGQASHRLLTGPQAGILAAAAKEAGFAPKAGQPLIQYEELIAQLELSTLGGEDKTTSQVIGTLAAAVAERQQREAHMKKIMEVELRRNDHLKADIRRLTTNSLKERVKAAEDSTYQTERVYDAEEHKEALSEAIQAERELPSKSQDKVKIDRWTSEKDRIDRFIHSLRRPTGRTITTAEIALLKNTLTNELTPISQSLSYLGGSTTRVGTSGQYGKSVTEMHTIAADRIAARESLETIMGTSIPTAQENLASIREAMVDSEVPRAQATAVEPNSALVATMEEQLRITKTNLNISNAQFSTLSNFAAHIPHYEKGGPVIEDGLIYAHKGEHVVPREGQLVAGGNGGQTTVNTTHVIQGSIAPLIELIDSRVTHPKNVRLVSRQMAQRVEANPGYRRV